MNDPNGMTLLDWFAGKALPAKITDADAFNYRASYDNRITPEDVAVACYRYADAMIAERFKSHQTKTP